MPTQQIQWISRQEFTTALEDKTLLPSIGLRKQFIPDQIKQVEGKDRTLAFTISTGAVDRDRDKINPKGWNLEAYRDNPVVLFAHSYHDLPVAKTVSISLQGDALVAEAEFASASINPFAESVYQMLKQGFLKGASVGFRPLKSVFNDERKGVDFEEQELLEFSVVPVPANAESLVHAKAAGIDIEPIKEWAHKILEASPEENEPDPAMVEIHDAIGKAVLSLTESEGDGLTQETEEAKAVTDTEDEADNGVMTADDCGLGDASESKESETTDLKEETNHEDDDTKAGTGETNAELDDTTISKAVPTNISNEIASEETPWRAPRLSDFTADAFADLGAGERRRIAKHYAYSRVLPPDAFDDMKLPHHRASDGFVIWNGVRAAMGALLGARGGVDIPDDERKAVYDHLVREYRRFEKTPPVFRMFEPEERALFEVADNPDDVMQSADIAALQHAGDLIADIVGSVKARSSQDAGEIVNEESCEKEMVMEFIEPPTVDIDGDDVKAIMAEVIRDAVAEALDLARGRVV